MVGKPRNGWLVPALAAASGVVLIVLILTARWLAETTTLPGLWQVAGIAITSGACLLIALAWASPLVRRSRANRKMRADEILLAAYVLPFLALTLPLRLAGAFLPSGEIVVSSREWLQLGPPWLLFIQAGLLAVAILPRAVQDFRGLRAEMVQAGSWRVSFYWMPALLSGTGLWLMAVFLFSLLSTHTSFNGLPEPLPSSGLMLFAVFLALAILPVAEEIFFRQVLIEQLAPSPQPTRLWVAWGLSALFFATLQFRPMLWLPAFFFSLGLSLLAATTGRVRECILAHILFNFLALMLNWATVL